MGKKSQDSDEKMLFCICPSCQQSRKKINNKYNIIRRGYERNHLARFFCLNCRTWFNEKTGDILKWLER